VGQVLESPYGSGELVVGLGCDLAAQLLQLHVEVHVGAAHRRDREFLGNVDVELALLALGHPHDVVFETRVQPVLAQDEGHLIRRPADELGAVAQTVERHDRKVTVRGGAAFHRLQVGLAVAQFVHHLLDHRLVDGLDLGLEREVLEVAELDLRPDLQGRLEDDRLALLGLGDLDLGRSQRHDLLLAHGLAHGILDEEIDGFFHDRRGTDHSLDDGPRRLAGPESRDAVLLRKAASGVVQRAGQALGRELELHLEAGLGKGGVGRLHRGRL